MTQELQVRRTHPSEYTELIQVLKRSEPSGAVILGALGMGKTTLVESALQALGFPEPVMRLYCTRSLSEVPHGALSPYLGGLESIENPVTVLRELNRTLLASPSVSETRIVVVEDAQYLDAQSCFILSLLVENGVVKVLALGGSSLEEGTPLASLGELPAFTRIQMQPLDREGIRQVAQSFLGRQLSEGSIRIIERVSGGNPRFVEAYVASCMDQDTLFQDTSLLQDQAVHEPLWVVARALPEVDARLRALGREFFRFVTAEEERTLLLLALAGPQYKALLDECALPYRRMLSSGDLEVRGETVSVRSKLLQRTFRELASVQQNAQLNELWARALFALGMEPNAREILWCLELGVEVPSEQILACASGAAAEMNFRVALRLCLLGQLSQHHEEGGLLEAQALLGLGRHYAARAQLLRLIDQLTDLDLLGQAYALLLEVTSCIGVDVQEAAIIMDKWQDAAAGYEDKAAVERFLALHTDALRVLKFWVGINTPSGTLPEVQDMRDYLDDPDLNVQARIIAMLTLGDRLTSEGLCHDALDVLYPAMQLLKEHAVLGTLYEVRVFFRIGWNLLFSGEYGKAQAFIGQYRGDRLRIIHHYRGEVALLDGIHELLQGRVRKAIEKMAEAITELRTFDTAQVLALACNVYRMLLYRFGLPQPEVLQQALNESQDKGASALSGQLGEESSEYRILARGFAAALESPYEGESIRDFQLIHREILFSKVRQLSDDELSKNADHASLRMLAKQQQGTRARLLSRLADLRISEGTEALEHLADEALQSCENLVAVEALARAAERHAAAGDQRRCGALLRRTTDLIEQHRMDPGKYLARVLAMTELTSREAEIVNLARRGLNNAQIARNLILSQRTVEGHLYRVFSKLGINERSELKKISS
ncbi:LuxR C-terminal-related transcriptional regulator [Glutamicibacter arilaitensis]|uniref:LuxR C-terminal-related transcriptional regulator n=1 Tax=Glutamicibacter arilaitensis TaxID=256701 RepID=UPI003F8DA974